MRDARWRQDPATENQKRFVESVWNKVPKPVQGEAENSADLIPKLTKGEAAYILTAFKHGTVVSVQFDSSGVKLIYRFP